MYRIYWNLHKQAYSISHKGIVVSHLHSALLHNVVFKVQNKGRIRVRKTKSKNVHAFICTSEIFNVSKWDCKLFERQSYVTYNPYKYKTFVRCDNYTPIHVADWVYLQTLVNEEGVMYPSVMVGTYLKPSRLTVENEISVLKRLSRFKLKSKVKVKNEKSS